VLFYAFAYAAANLAAFAVVLAVQRARGSVDVSAFAGLGRSHPWWTAALVLSLLSLFGLPPLAGFVAKLEVFSAAIDAGQAWLAVVGIAMTVVSLYPYLRVIAPAVLAPAGGPVQAPRTPRPGLALAAALGVSAVATVVVGIGAEPFLSLAEEARAMR
jgi:NADH-quinone oxidoreductase subunit N